jgi:YidC/Oxa1 family membrane protein insertase
MLNTLVTQPFLNLLFALYTAIPGHDFGLAVIILTVVIRFALYPLAKKQLHSQKAMTAIQPEVNKLKEKYKDPQVFQAKVMELYKEKEVNPYGSCLPLIIQMPFILGLFYVFIKFKDPNFLPLNSDTGIMSQIYPWLKDLGFVKSFLANNTAVDTRFLGLVDLSKPNVYLAVFAGALQFVQSKMLTPKKKEKDAQSNMMSGMTYIFPFLTVFIALSLPAALPIYWSVTTLFAIGQQYLVMHHDVEVLEESSERKRSKKS